MNREPQTYTLIEAAQDTERLLTTCISVPSLLDLKQRLLERHKWMAKLVCLNLKGNVAREVPCRTATTTHQPQIRPCR